MTRSSIILIGPMGSGKTTVGKILAKEMSMHFIDSDQLIEESLGVSISWIFDQEGEAGFRLRETKMLKQLLQQSGNVIATGGGIVTVEENRKMLTEANCLIIYLRPNVQLLCKRLMYSDHRPLLEGADDRRQQIQNLFEQRDPLYKQVADITHSGGNVTVAKQVQQLSRIINECLNIPT